MACSAYSSDHFFFNDTATTEIYTLSLHDALPISRTRPSASSTSTDSAPSGATAARMSPRASRSEEHTSELQSQFHLVCRLLLEKKNKEQVPTSGVARSAEQEDGPRCRASTARV